MGAITVFYSLLVFALSSINVESSAIQQAPSHVHNFGIFGGTPINITEVPFMAMLRPKVAIWSCGASIVDKQFLITAAHCVASSERNATQLRITVGTDNAIKGGEDYEIEKLFPHPKFDPVTLNFDIAVVKLSKKLVYSDKVKPIKMATSRPKDGDILDTMGFGKTENGQGDSGGPIRYNGELIGATSWGHDCGIAGNPGVYSYLPSMRDFIDKVMKNNS